MPIVNIIDTEIVTSRLIASGWEKDIAVGLYGQLTSFCGALVNFPQVLTQAVAMSLVPLVAAVDSTVKENHASLVMNKNKWTDGFVRSVADVTQWYNNEVEEMKNFLQRRCGI